MVNKKGWVRIIEATICALIIIAVVLIYAQDNKSYFNIESYADVESVVDEMIKEEDIRTSILDSSLGQPNLLINNELQIRIKRSGIIINNTVCDIDMVNSNLCKISRSDKIQNIHVYERIISTNPDQEYDFEKTRTIKIIIYQEIR